MIILLREMRAALDQGTEYQDREVSASVITLGSRQDQSIQLLGAQVAGAHAELRASAGVLQIKATSGNTLSVNGEACTSATLQVGERVQIGGHVLEATAPPAGFDGGLLLIPDAKVDGATFENAYATSLDDTWLSKRWPAWFLLAAVLVLALAVPLYLISDGDETTPADDAAVLTDAIWTSGPLHAVHNQSIGNDCGACHAKLFERVQDDACLACHKGLEDHVMPGHAALEVMPAERCAVCHKEHNEPEQLVISADSLCVDCHEDGDSFGSSSPHIASASGFSSGAHPLFEVALPMSEAVPKATGLVFEWGLYERELDGAEERSNLKFPHDLHLDPETVTTQAGVGMACGDCHTLSPDREHFVPVTMANHCQDCHELTFDPTAPQRQLPHGQPSEAVATMEGHFIRVFADPARRVEPEAERRRRPGRSPRNANACTGSAFDCAMTRTETEVINQFTRSGCVTCHQVEDTGSSDIGTRFQVYPVRLSGDFMPTARFDHHSHLTQKGKEGDEACLTCHEAEASSVSTDLMIPNLGNCLECHTDHREANSVPLNCVSCHAYHPDEPLPPLFTERSP